MQPQPDGVKVLFLAGKGRSGGTLLANLLGQIPGYFNVGELNRLGDWGLVENYRCGCGVHVRECATWCAILDQADSLLRGSSMAPLAEARLDLDQAAVVRWPLLLRLLKARPETRDRWEALERYTTATSAVYRSIAAITGARVIVDSSRLPLEPVALGLVPGVDVRIGHLVRDPRAVVYSWKRSRVFTDRDAVEHLPRFSAAFSTASWMARNLVVEILTRRHAAITVRYDALARDPATVLRQLADLVDEPANDLGFLTSETASLVPTHSVGGNPVRMISGEVSIEPDDEWRRGISWRDRLVTTLLAMPLLRRYGFDVRSSERASEYPPSSPERLPAS
jgi:Sulfotransferase family